MFVYFIYFCLIGILSVNRSVQAFCRKCTLPEHGNMKPKCLFIIFTVAALYSCVKGAVYADHEENNHGSEGVFDTNSETVPGWIRIKLTEDAAPLPACSFSRGEFSTGNAQLDDVAARLGATEIRRVFNEGGKFAGRRRRYGLHLWYDLRIEETVPVSRAAAEMAAVQGIEAVEPVYKTRLDSRRASADFSDRLYAPANPQPAEEEPPFNDPYLYKQWNYHNDGTLESSVAGADINVFKAWRRFGAGNPDIIVAVIDGGIQYDHPDLAANMWTNDAELHGIPGFDDDGNGYIDDVYGWNFYMESGNIVPHYHGTHVAGTVAAVNNNGEGVCGVAGGTGAGDGVRLMSCQNYTTDMAGENIGYDDPDAFIYAADMGAVIAQNSWGYADYQTMPGSMKRAILYFIREAGSDENGVQTGPMKGGIVCFSAGNSSRAVVSDPATMEEVIAVTSMEADYARASYSNYGVGADIMAPGGSRAFSPSNPYQVYSTYTGSGYGYLYGTSMACPHVSGVAALIVSHYGVGRSGFTAEECRDILLRSYRPVGEYMSPEVAASVGVGLVDASLITLENPYTSPAPVENLRLTPGDGIMGVSALLPADGNGDSVLKIYVDYVLCGQEAASGERMTRVFHNALPPGTRFEKELELVCEMSYEIGVSTEDRFGNRSERVSAVGTVLPHINVPPIYEPVGDHIFPLPKYIYRKSVDLSGHFSDPDALPDEELVYASESSRPEIVEVFLEGSLLTMVPKHKGKTTVTVSATDMDGATASGTFSVNVLSGATPPVDPPIVDPPVEERGFSIYPNPVQDELHIIIPGGAGSTASIVIYDAGVRRALDCDMVTDGEAHGIIDVSVLTAGSYTLSVKWKGGHVEAAFIKK